MPSIGLDKHKKMRRTGRRGFTLVEVLVVLSILVILFGLLFAPMMVGMDMATTGRAQARLQDVARAAAEQMRRELANAMYVYPPPAYTTDTGDLVTDYSQIVFVPTMTDNAGRPTTPATPRTWTDPATGVPEYQVVRYFVKPPDLTGSKIYDANNPFVLMRQEGLYRYNSALGAYEFGSIDPADGLFYVDLAETENAMTPREDYDIPATSTVCLASGCGKMVVGYVDECPACAGTALVYLHDDVKFQPARITGEPLAPSQNNSVYEARHGNWMGTPNNGTIDLTASALLGAELEPRFMVYRYEGTDDAFTSLALDSATPAARSMRLRWNSSTGTVQIGEWRTVKITVDAQSPPAAGEFWPVTVEGDVYGTNGTLSGAQTAPMVPLYPAAPANWGDPAMPIAYRIDPQYSDGSGVAAKIVPNSTRVTISPRAGLFTQYTRVSGLNQNEVGTYQYAESMPVNQLSAEIRFNRLTPPAPFGGSTSFEMLVSYYYRRNFDNSAPYYRDDVVYADYSTGEIINITLIPQRFVELEELTSGGQVVPPDLPVGGMPVRTQAVVQNARR